MAAVREFVHGFISSDYTCLQAVVLIPSWEQPVAGNLSGKLGAFWELVIGSDASARSLGIGWEPGSQKISLGALKLQKGPRACQLRLGPRKTTTGNGRRDAVAAKGR